MTADEVLESGEYVDRRGRVWGRILGTEFWSKKPSERDFDRRGVMVSIDEMRLLIERDTHRDECDWMEQCCNHPVPHVLGSVSQGFYVYEVRADWADQSLGTHAEAMDAAYKLAVGE